MELADGAGEGSGVDLGEAVEVVPVAGVVEEFEVNGAGVGADVVVGVSVGLESIAKATSTRLGAADKEAIRAAVPIIFKR